MPLLPKKDHPLEEGAYWIFSNHYDFCYLTVERLRVGPF